MSVVVESVLYLWVTHVSLASKTICSSERRWFFVESCRLETQPFGHLMDNKRKQFVMLLGTVVLLVCGCANPQNRIATIPVARTQQNVDMRFGIARKLEHNGKLVLNRQPQQPNEPPEKSPNQFDDSQKTIYSLPTLPAKSDKALVVATEPEDANPDSIVVTQLSNREGLKIVEIDTVAKDDREMVEATESETDDIASAEFSPAKVIKNASAESAEARDPLSVFADEFKIFK